MDSDRWQKIESLYLAALERKESERASFLFSACADDEDLLREVESLLAFQAPAENFMKSPAVEVAAQFFADDQASLPEAPESHLGIAGKTVSHYRILSKIGGGGMGVVYQAEDTRLRRSVALKFLPEGIDWQQQAFARLRREAETASALNHPNICTIYDVGEADGQPFIAMELLEGSTLKHRLASGPLEFSTAIDFAIQLCDALYTAHAKGIIHRDIKPDNIFITDLGYVKVLDFGIAKQLSAGSAELSHEGEIEVATKKTEDPLTHAGVIPGTVSYMSPEQVRGEPLDPRTDIFSFGVVLYEMATGHQAYKGETEAAASAAILARTPKPARELNPAVPASLEKIICKALEKNRDLRYQNATDIRSDLKGIQRGPRWGRAVRVSRWRRPMAVGVIASGLLAVTTLFWVLRAPLPPPKIMKTTRLTKNRLPKNGPLASDGHRLFFTEWMEADGHYVPVGMPVEGGNAVPVPTPFKDVSLLNVSPDGSELLLRQCDTPDACHLWVMPSEGGEPRRLGDAVGASGSWSPDGKQIAWGDGPDVDVMNRDGTGSRKLVKTGAGKERQVGQVAWSPDGKLLRFVYGPEIWEASASGAHPHPLLPGWQNEPDQAQPAWTHDGKHFIFASAGQLWAIRENPGIFRKAENPVQLTAGPGTFSDPLPSRDGKKIFAIVNDQSVELIRFDLRSKEFVPYLRGISAGHLRFSKDGQWIAYRKIPEGGLWRSRVDGSEELLLTNSSTEDAYGPEWSPDGKRIAFIAPGAKMWKVYLVSTDGKSAPIEAFSKEGCTYPSWSPDGASLICDCLTTSDETGLYVFDLKTHQMSPIPDSKEKYVPRYSPDGLSVVASDDHQVAIFDLQQRKWWTLVEIKGPDWPIFSRDGRYVYFMANGIFRVRLADSKLEKVASLDNVNFHINWLSLAPDDSPLLARGLEFPEIVALDWETP